MVPFFYNEKYVSTPIENLVNSSFEKKNFCEQFFLKYCIKWLNGSQLVKTKK